MILLDYILEILLSSYIKTGFEDMVYVRKSFTNLCIYLFQIYSNIIFKYLYLKYLPRFGIVLCFRSIWR
ncbi:hypothetical protein HW49_01445 [Porphyromonadaceae bacterium COT-184 OH4590]|nr:hypothetical protein HW49_01445 [Porphyromonadaceae bacterium COT-184 OH4590]